MKLYHVKTQADYDALMQELEEQGCRWTIGERPTELYVFGNTKENTIIKVDDKKLTYHSMGTNSIIYPNTPIIEYTAKGKENVKNRLKEKIQSITTILSLNDTLTGSIEDRVAEAVELIDQLEEPEITEEQAWEVIERANHYHIAPSHVKEYKRLIHAGTVLNDVNKKEKPVIPQFVAEWIEEVKPDNSLRVAFEYIAQQKRDNHDDELAFWAEEGNSETFARAWLDGYTIKKEQKYYARIKGWENVTTGSERFYWVYFKEKDTIGISKAVKNKYQAVSFTKNDWNNLGINEHNADFVLVEELEE